MRKICFLIFISTILFSCKNSNKVPENDGIPVLKASLTETKTSFFDLFERAELIPLETTDQSLIKGTRKIECFNDTLYVFDDDLYALFIFDKDGKYLNKIHRIGNGPGEYTLIYDFCLDKKEHTIEMLSPFGVHYRYGFDTQFIKSYNLPSPPESHSNFEYCAKDSFIYWSLMGPNGEGHEQLNLISLEPTENIGRFHVKDHHHTQTSASFPFYRYNNHIYFMRPFSNGVYQFTGKEMEVAYVWDFGKETMTIDVETHKYRTDPDVNEEKMKFCNMFDNGEVPEAPYCYVYQNQTDLYYYTRLRFTSNIRKNMFYNKKTHDYLFFKETTEGIDFNPIYFSDDCLIFAVEPDKKAMLLPVLSGSDRAKWEEIGETDNPVLMKCYFKK